MNYRKKTYRSAAAITVAAMILGGCAAREEYTGGHVTEEAPQISAEQAKLNMIQTSAYNNVNGLNLEPDSYISILGRSGEGAYWDQIREGMDQAVEDLNTLLGYEGGDKIRATYNAPDREDNVDDQVSILDEELDRYPLAVGIAIADVSACEVQFDLATENGIPVVAFDSGSDYQGLMATVQTDNDGSAREVADHMAEQMGETGQVLILVDNSKAKAQTTRESAFRDQMATGHTGITVAGTCYLDQMEEAAEAAEEAADTEETAAADGETEELDPVQEILSQYPDVTGIFAVSSNAVSFGLELTEAMEDASEETGAETENQLVFVGYDAEEEEIEALSEGTISGLIVQNPYGMGYATVVAAARAALGQGNEAVVNTGYQWVTTENLETEEIQRILY